ncbi:MAG TPA: alpha/beta fold hydrolase [Vicinamibacterales bacterium]|nr:alpha/beta fold hydrolase [Vicinamibacterales bacterium]
MPEGSIDIGTGTPIVLIPGVQGRWEWMRPAVLELSRRFRVLSFTLAGERTSHRPLDPQLGFDTFVEQTKQLLDASSVREAIICGISYGGLIALRFAGQHTDRARGLVLVSAPPPDYRPDAIVESYLRAPWLRSPLFLLRAARRGLREIRCALPGWSDRARAACRHASCVILSPAAPPRMAERVRLLERVDVMDSVRRCRHVPTLLVTGEPDLDEVVDVESTLRYRELLENVSVRRIDRTGHLGLVLRADAFADAIADFVAALERRREFGSERAG